MCIRDRFTPSEIDNLDGQLSLFAGWSEMSAEADGEGTASGGAKRPSETAAAMVIDTGSRVGGSGAVKPAAMSGADVYKRQAHSGASVVNSKDKNTVPGR